MKNLKNFFKIRNEKKLVKNKLAGPMSNTLNIFPRFFFNVPITKLESYMPFNV